MCSTGNPSHWRTAACDGTGVADSNGAAAAGAVTAADGASAGFWLQAEIAAHRRIDQKKAGRCALRDWRPASSFKVKEGAKKGRDVERSLLRQSRANPSAIAC